MQNSIALSTNYSEYRAANGHTPMRDNTVPVARGLAELMGWGGFGVMVCDANGRVRMANRAALAIVAKRQTLVLRDGRVRALRRSDDARLREALADMAATLPASRASREIALSIPCATGAAPLGVLVLAAMEDEPLTAPGDVLVLLNERDTKVSLVPELLVASYGFTRREAFVAAEIANGFTVQETAERLNIAEQTVRKHLRKLFEKTNTNRQAELVGMLRSGVELFATRESPLG